MNTFTAQELADFFQKVADGGEAQLKIDGEWSNLFVGGPAIGSSKDIWRIKPTKKVIDLSVLVDSGIDVEVSDGNDRWYLGGCLRHIYETGARYSCANSIVHEKQCRPRMNHKHAWQGGECPLPEGFLVRTFMRGADYYLGGIVLLRPTLADWSHGNHPADIIAFEVLGLADGYVMPWEQDNA
tara:strand:+ start:93 stop:641 length:549 start_codon:yes stop_codon:yes gene_type:complete